MKFILFLLSAFVVSIVAASIENTSSLVKEPTKESRILELRKQTGFTTDDAEDYFTDIKKKAVELFTSEKEGDLFENLKTVIQSTIKQASKKIDNSDYTIILLSSLKLFKDSILLAKDKGELIKSLEKFSASLNYQNDLFEKYELVRRMFAPFTLIGVLSLTRSLSLPTLLEMTRTLFKISEENVLLNSAMNSSKMFSNLMGDTLLWTYSEALNLYKEESSLNFKKYYGIYSEELVSELQGIRFTEEFKILTLKLVTEFVEKDEKDLELWRDMTTAMLSCMVYGAFNKEEARQELWKLIPVKDRALFDSFYKLESVGHAMLVEVERINEDGFGIRLFNSNNETLGNLGHAGYIIVDTKTKDKEETVTALTLNMKIDDEKTLKYLDKNRNLAKVLHKSNLLSYENIRFLPFVDFTIDSFKELSESQYFSVVKNEEPDEEQVVKKLYPKQKSSLSIVKAPLFLFQKQQSSGTCVASSLWVYLRSKLEIGMKVEIKLRMRLVTVLFNILKPFFALKDDKKEEFMRIVLKGHAIDRAISREFSDDLIKEKEANQKALDIFIDREKFDLHLAQFIPNINFFLYLANNTIHEAFEWILHVQSYDRALAKSLWDLFESEKTDDFAVLDCDFKQLRNDFERKKPVTKIEFINTFSESREVQSDSEDEEEKERTLKKLTKHTITKDQEKLLEKMSAECLDKKPKEDKKYAETCFPLIVESLELFSLDDGVFGEMNLEIAKKWKVDYHYINTFSSYLLYRYIETLIKDAWQYKESSKKNNLFYFNTLRKMASNFDASDIIEEGKTLVFNDKEFEKCEDVDYLDFKGDEAKKAIYCYFLLDKMVEDRIE